MHRALALLVMAFAVGCSSTTGGVALLGTEDLQKQPQRTIAAVYGDQYWGGGSKLEAELKRRNAFTDAEWAQIKERKVGIGDRGELVLAAWGGPDDARDYTEAGGTTSVWRYDGRSTVWLQNDRVTMIRN